MLIQKNSTIKNFRVSITAILIALSVIFIQTPTSADTKREIAESYRQQGLKAYKAKKHFEALEYYNKALELKIESPELYNDTGVLYEEIGSTGKAEAFYLQAISLDKGYLAAYTNLGYLYLDSGQEDLAVEYFKMRYELADPYDSWAEKAKEEILALRPSYSRWFQSMDAKRLESQIEEKNRAQFEDNIKRSKEYLERARQYVQEERYREAIHEFDKSLMLVPTNPNVIEQRKEAVLELAEQRVREGTAAAIRRLNSGDPESAKIEIQRMLSTIPSYSDKREY